MFRHKLASAAAAIFVPLACSTAQHPVQKGVESIVEHDVRRRIGVIADDSMGGRNTPSKGLDRTAAYIASEFKRFGLKPAGDDGTFIQRYPLSRVKIDGEASYVTLTRAATSVTLRASSDLLYLSGGRTGAPIHAPVVLVGGVLDSAAAHAVAPEQKIVVVVAPNSMNLNGQNKFVAALLTRQPAAIVMVSARDSVSFARQIALQSRERISLGVGGAGGAPVIAIPERRVRALLTESGVDIAALRASRTFEVREVPTLQMSISVRDEAGSSPTAPNVVGILEGSDPQLRNEYVLFSAHMDHVGTNPSVKGDSIWNGADDDASGTIGVLELAEAFARVAQRPRRSMIFLTVSGEEKGLWGSEYFASNMPVPAKQVVADLNIDMIGRNWKDTIVAIGKEHSDLGATLDRVNREHPELGMHAIDDIWPNENFYSRSDHFNFARRGIPILFFFNGTHADYHQPSDSPDKIDAEKEVRILRLIYYLGATVANTTERPKWNKESYDRIVQ